MNTERCNNANLDVAVVVATDPKTEINAKTKGMEKHEFMAPADVAESRVETTVAPAAISAIPVEGTWSNSDPATRGIAKIVIGAAGQDVNVHAFAACSPTPCDWGAVQGSTYANGVGSNTAVGFIAQYKLRFKETTMAGHLEGTSLILEKFDRFTDGSGRSNYYSKASMHK